MALPVLSCCANGAEISLAKPDVAASHTQEDLRHHGQAVTGYTSASFAAYLVLTRPLYIDCLNSLRMAFIRPPDHHRGGLQWPAPSPTLQPVLADRSTSALIVPTWTDDLVRVYLDGPRFPAFNDTAQRTDGLGLK